MLALTLLLHLSMTATKPVELPALQEPAPRESKFRIEPNMGRYAEEVKYVMFVQDGVVLFTDDGMVDSSGVGVVLKNSNSGAFNALGFRCAVRNTLENDGPLYIPIYSKLVRRNVYEGIDAIYALSPEGELEVSFFLQPNAKLSDILVAYQGVEKIETTKQNELALKTITGKVVQRCPRILRLMGDRYVALSVGMKLGGDGYVRFSGRAAGLGD